MSRNVLHLIDSFHTGGSERQAIQLARLLHDSGRFKVYIATLKNEGALKEDANSISEAPVEDYPLTSFYDPNAVRQTRRFARFLREREIDIIHTHDFYSNVFGMISSRIAGTPVRIASRRETTGTRSPMKKRIERLCYGISHKIIVNAAAVQRHLIHEGISAAKTEVIYNGLDLSKFKVSGSVNVERIRANLGLPVGRPLVTLVANMKLAVKNHPMFLRAAAKVMKVFPRAAFVLAGEGPLMIEIKKLGDDIGLADHLFFTGPCDNVVQLLAVSEICVLSSSAEGFSNSILEYMAAGKPVVATDVGGAREAVTEGETGYLVGSGNESEMASRLIELLRDPVLAERLGKRGREKSKEFSKETQLAKTESLYEKLLDQSLTKRASESRKIHSSDTTPRIQGIK